MVADTAWPSDPKKRRELERALDEGAIDELPPNVPPGLLGETPPDFRKVDGDGSHGLNAGVLQEWTWETTIIVVILCYIFFFPAAFFVLWRSRTVSRKQKVVMSILMTLGILFVAARLLEWF